MKTRTKEMKQSNKSVKEGVVIAGAMILSLVVTIGVVMGYMLINF